MCRTFSKIAPNVRRQAYRFFISLSDRGAVVLALQQRRLRLYCSKRVTADTRTRALQKSWIAKLTYLCRDTVNEIGDKLQLK
jgi:hypothetical protein